MTARLYNTAGERWETRYPRMYSTTRARWEEQPGGNPLSGMERSPFTPYIAQGTVWTRDISAMPLHTDSAQMAAWMWSETPTPYSNVNGTSSGAWGSKTSFNTSSYGTQPISLVVVDSTDPNCHYQYMDTAALPNSSGFVGVGEDAKIKGRLPWPKGMIPAQGGDRGLAIYDMGTGLLREYFGVQPVANMPGHWTAATGGYSLAKPFFQDWAQTNYPTQLQNGSSAVCLMHNAVGFVGIDEVRRGHIGHAMAYTMANATGGKPASWPGIWSDGKYPPSTWSGWGVGNAANRAYPGDSPRHGQWGRLAASVDPMYNPRTGLAYNPLTRLLIQAAKDYGLCGTDTNAWCHAFNGESGYREKALTGVDPWAGSGELANVLNPLDPSQAFNVSDFPWDLTEWSTVDWGRPNPDFRLRPGEYWVYEPHTR